MAKGIDPANEIAVVGPNSVNAKDSAAIAMPAGSGEVAKIPTEISVGKEQVGESKNLPQQRKFFWRGESQSEDVGPAQAGSSNAPEVDAEEVEDEPQPEGKKGLSKAVLVFAGIGVLAVVLAIYLLFGGAGPVAADGNNTSTVNAVPVVAAEKAAAGNNTTKDAAVSAEATILKKQLQEQKNATAEVEKKLRAQENITKLMAQSKSSSSDSSGGETKIVYVKSEPEPSKEKPLENFFKANEQPAKVVTQAEQGPVRQLNVEPRQNTAVQRPVQQLEDDMFEQTPAQGTVQQKNAEQVPAEVVTSSEGRRQITSGELAENENLFRQGPDSIVNLGVQYSDLIAADGTVVGRKVVTDDGNSLIIPVGKQVWNGRSFDYVAPDEVPSYVKEEKYL